jgi:hypothetical protein
MPLPPHPPFEVRPAEPGETVVRLMDGPQLDASAFLTDEQDGRVESLAATGSMAIYRGCSVRRTSFPQARRLARLMRREYVAEVTLTWKEGDAIARTFSSAGHLTLWGNPELLATRAVVRAVSD